MPDFCLIDLASDGTLVGVVSKYDRIGVDTEFMRERTYFAELCLLQVATPDEIFCADPLNRSPGNDKPFDEFWKAIIAPEWVVHSARQDIEVIYQTSGLMPKRIFDTQIAAAFLGFQPQVGYAGLVRELFGVELDKSHTRADWSKRPLADAVLQYAAEDVQYLLPAYEKLHDRLEEAGRLDWASQDSNDLLDTSLYETDPANSIDRLKGARNLRGRARAAAIRLATWRETEALRTNRPRQWIMRDAVLIEIAVACPQALKDLADIDGLMESTIRRAGSDLLRLVAEATHDSSGYEPPSRPDEQQKKLLKEMQRRVTASAVKNELGAELLAPRKELSAALLGNRDSRVFKGWRRDLIGNQLLELLENV
jgi:ribonuclease D